MFKISLKSNLNPTFLLNLITSFKDYKFKKSFKPFKYTLKILLILILITNFLLNESENQSFTTLYKLQKPTLDLEFKTDKTRKLSQEEIQKIKEENQAKNTKLDLNSLEPEIKVSYSSIVGYLTNFQTSPNIPITKIRFFGMFDKSFFIPLGF